MRLKTICVYNFIVCSLLLIGSAYCEPEPKGGLPEEAEEGEPSGKSEGDKNDADESSAAEKEGSGEAAASPDSARKLGHPFFRNKLAEGGATHHPWSFGTVLMNDFRDYLATKTTRAAPDTIKPAAINVPELIEVVRNLTSDYDNDVFITKLNKTLVRMRLPECQSSPVALKSSSELRNCVLSSVLVTVFAGILFVV